MHISIEHKDGKYPSFNVNLHSSKDAEPFLEIKGVAIRQGGKGPFLSWPATKNQQSGKYWNHCYGSEAFNAHVMQLAQVEDPKPAPRPRLEAPDNSRHSDRDDYGDAPPF